MKILSRLVATLADFLRKKKNFNRQYKIKGRVTKCFKVQRHMSLPRPDESYYFRANLIWWDSPFNIDTRLPAYCSAYVQYVWVPRSYRSVFCAVQCFETKRDPVSLFSENKSTDFFASFCIQKHFKTTLFNYSISVRYCFASLFCFVSLSFLLFSHLKAAVRFVAK